jgi:hypothetical protein
MLKVTCMLRDITSFKAPIYRVAVFEQFTCLEDMSNQVLMSHLLFLKFLFFACRRSRKCWIWEVESSAWSQGAMWYCLYNERAREMDERELIIVCMEKINALVARTGRPPYAHTLDPIPPELYVSLQQ